MTDATPTPPVPPSHAASAQPRSVSAPAPFAGFGASFVWGLRLAFRRRRFFIYLAIAAAVGIFLGTTGVARDHRFGNNSTEYKIHELWNLIDYVCIQWLLPIVAMMFVAGGYAREVRDRTLVYHLVRPIRRSTIFLSRYLAGVIPAILASLVLMYAIMLGSQQEVPNGVWLRLIPFAAMAMIALGALFYTLGALFKRGTIAGLIYLFVFESILTANRGSVRDLALLHHIRALGRGLFGDLFGESSWAVREKLRSGEVSELTPSQGTNISQALDQLTASPDFASTPTAFLILGCVAVAILIIGVMRIARRDYPLKD